MTRTTPPFRADMVGSLLRTAPLKEARARRQAGGITAGSAESGRGPGDREDHRPPGGDRPATCDRRRVPPLLVAFRFSQVTRRGAKVLLDRQGIQFHGVQTKPEGVRVTGKLGFSGHPMLEHFRFLKSHTRARPEDDDPEPERVCISAAAATR